MKNSLTTIYDKSLRLALKGNERRYINTQKRYAERITHCSKDLNAAVISRKDGDVCTYCKSEKCAYASVIDGIPNETLLTVRRMIGYLKMNQMLSYDALMIPNPDIDEANNFDADKIAFIEKELTRRFGVPFVYRDLFSIERSLIRLDGESPYKVTVDLRVALAELIPAYYFRFYVKKLVDVRSVAEILEEFGERIPKFYRIIYQDLGTTSYDIFSRHLSPVAISEFLNRYNECEDPKDMEKFFSRLGYSNTRLFNEMDWESVKNMTFFENNTDLDISEKIRKRCYYGTRAKRDYPVVASFIRKNFRPELVPAYFPRG